MALMSACICYFVPSHSLSNGVIVSHDGKTDGLFSMGYTVMSILVLVHHGLVALYTRNWTWLMVGAYILSLFLYFPIETVGSEY